MFISLRSLQETGQFSEWPVDLTPIVDWLKGFICQPHVATNRSSAVCPCAVDALHNDKILFTHLAFQNGEDAKIKREKAVANLLLISQEFKKVTSNEEYALDCLLVTVSELQKHELRYVIGGAYSDIKIKVLENKLMIGGFHEFNNRPSAYNADFYPMRTPIPVFALRHMNRSDWKSLQENGDYITIYNRFYGAPPPSSDS